MTPTTGAAELSKCTAADGTTEVINVPGHPLMVRAVDFNRLHAQVEAPSDDDLVTLYKRANGEDTGKAQPLTTKRIVNAMRAAFQAGRASTAQPAEGESNV